MLKRLVIADDTLFMRALIRDTVTKAGLMVLGEAKNGKEAIEQYRQHQPDLLILNIIMPELSGLEALKQIREWDPQARILICSAMGKTGTVMQAIRLGAADFLIKPFSADQLLQIVMRLLTVEAA